MYGLQDYSDQISARKDQLQEDGVLIGDSMAGRSYTDVSADITRMNWDQFEQNDMPYILNYSQDIVSGRHRQRGIDQAKEGVNRGFALSEASQQRRNDGLGLGLSDAQVNDNKSDSQRDKTAALVDASNKASLAGLDRENALLAGSHLPKVGEQ